jgi:hypothetical protein
MVIIPLTRKREIMKLMELIFFNNTIQLSNKVKNLGLMLDKGLTWKKQLDMYPTGTQGLLDVQRHIWHDLGTETKGDVLDEHHGCKTHHHLCCHCVVD